MAATSTDIKERLADALRQHGLLTVAHADKLADVLLSLPGIAITDTEAAVTLRIRDGSWELTFSNGGTASAPVGHPAALLTAHLAEGDQVTFAAAAAEAQEEQP